MSIEALQQSLDNYENTHPLFFGLNDSQAKKHLILLSRCLLELYKKVQPETFKAKEQEPLISLMEFYTRTHLCHPSTLARIIHKDEGLFNGTVSKKGTKFYVREKKMLAYLASDFESPKVRPKAQKLLQKLVDEEKRCYNSQVQSSSALEKLLIS
jgi:hypothetical protein